MDDDLMEQVIDLARYQMQAYYYEIELLISQAVMLQDFDKLDRLCTIDDGSFTPAVGSLLS